MPQAPNRLLRLLVPLGVLAIGAGIVIAVIKNTGRHGTSPAPASTPSPAAATPLATAPSPAAGANQAKPQPGIPEHPARVVTVSLEGLRAQAMPDAAFTPIGSLDKSSPNEVMVEFSTLGAGVKSITLTRHFETIEKKRHIVIQAEQTYTNPSPGSLPETVTPLAALGLEIEGRMVDLLFSVGQEGGPRSVWREVSPGAFEAIIVNGAAERIARVERIYTLTPGSFTLRLTQRVTNLTGVPLSIRWQQFGPTDLNDDAAGYGGDKRRVRFGYLYPPEIQKGDPTVLSDQFQYARSSVLGSKGPNGLYDEVRTVWPNPRAASDRLRLVWLGVSNRYFGVAMLPLVDAGAGPDAKVFRAAETVDRVLLHRWNPDGRYDPLQIMRTTSMVQRVAGGAAADVSMGVYAGPLERPRIRKDAAAGPVGLSGLVLYNFGGMCGPCTFSFLTGWLLGLLLFLHEYVVFDWALSIMVLVLIVRTILHPVTKWSQIRLQRFGKQMQAMAPKQKQIQEKYKDDPRKMREEMAKLWREEGVSPTGALGCIPMLMQTPVWIALYATLYFAVELRHQGAFFGVFQAVAPGHPRFLGWFLGDLAEPDRFFYFRRDFHIPLISGLLGPIHSVNILPLILGAVFYIQQKYLTPPPTTALTPEQKQQQVMMKWMLVVLFPLMMYNAPSGLALYFIVNSTLGILESRYIRKHIDKYDLLKPKTPPGKGGGPRPGGFFARLQQLAEERQKQMLKARGKPMPRKRV